MTFNGRRGDFSVDRENTRGAGAMAMRKRDGARFDGPGLFAEAVEIARARAARHAARRLIDKSQSD